MEGSHGQLGSGFTDRLSRNHTYGLAEFDLLAGGQRTAVAQRADAEFGIAGEHRADLDAVDGWVITQSIDLVLTEQGIGFDPGATVLKRCRQVDVTQQRTPKKLGVEIAARRLGIGGDVFDPDTERGAAIVLADDEFLSDIDESPGEIAGVGGSKSGIDESLAGAWRRDEVLEGFEPFTEVRLDRPRDHVTTRVGHQAAHTGDLLHLGHIAPRTRADHHVDRVEALGPELCLHCLLNIMGGVGPDANLLLAPLTIGDDAPTELRLDAVGLLLVSIEEFALAGRRFDVLDRNRQTRLRCVSVAEVLDGIERVRNIGSRIVLRQALDDEPHLFLLDRRLDMPEMFGVVGRKGLLEHRSTNGGLVRLTIGWANRDGGVQ